MDNSEIKMGLRTIKQYSALLVLILFFAGLVIGSRAEDSKVEDEEMSCPEMCVKSQKNCELSCSQIVGGGAKSKERRSCVKDCGGELEKCKVRCLNPTPKPTLKPERYHNKSCPNACEFKSKDCYQVCTKYTGGGAKSGDRARCQNECRESEEDCKNWCVNPTPKPTLKPDPLEGKPCPEVCGIKKLDCEANCSSFLGGGAKSSKRSECKNDCQNSFDECSDSCLK